MPKCIAGPKCKNHDLAVGGHWCPGYKQPMHTICGFYNHHKSIVCNTWCPLCWSHLTPEQGLQAKTESSSEQEEEQPPAEMSKAKNKKADKPKPKSKTKTTVTEKATVPGKWKTVGPSKKPAAAKKAKKST